MVGTSQSGWPRLVPSEKWLRQVEVVNILLSAMHGPSDVGCHYWAIDRVPVRHVNTLNLDSSLCRQLPITSEVPV